MLKALSASAAAAGATEQQRIQNALYNQRREFKSRAMGAVTSARRLAMMVFSVATPPTGDPNHQRTVALQGIVSDVLTGLERDLQVTPRA